MTAFHFPADVPGWLHPTEGEALAALAAGKTVLEIGSYCGLSTVCMARTALHVISIDPHDGRGTPVQRNTFDLFRENLLRYGVAKKVVPILGTSSEVYQRISSIVADFVFVDGSHDYHDATFDIEYARECLKSSSNPLIAVHDYRTFPGEFDGWDPGVTQAVDDKISQGWKLLDRHRTIAVLKPPG